MVKFKAIVAISKNGIIGNQNELPWKGDVSLKWDMENFKEQTMNKIVIMGYNTYKTFNRPLKNRLNLVLAHPENNEKFYSLKDDKFVYKNLDLHTKFDESTIEDISNEVDKSAIDEYWERSFPYINENNGNSFINKVNMTNNGLDTLFSFITIDSFDYRFIFVPQELLSNKDKRLYEFDHLARNIAAIKDICISNYKKSGCNNDSITKIKNFNPNEVYIIGGSKTYKKYIDLIDEFIVTRFDNEYNGNIKFDESILDKFKNQEIIKEVPNSGKIIRYYN